MALSNAAFNAKFNAKFNQKFAAGKAGRVAPPRAATISGGGGSPVAAFLNPGRALSGQALLQAAKALANASEQPTIQGLQSSIGANDQQTQNALRLTGGYYNQLGNQARQGVADERNIAGQLNSQLGGIAANEQSALAGIGNNADTMLSRYTPGDPSQSSAAAQALHAELGRQRGLAAQDEGAFRSFGATQGANNRGLAASQLGTSALAGQEGLRAIAQAGLVKNEPLTSRLASAISQRGNLIETDLGRLRQQEINNSISRAGLGIRQQSATAALRNAGAHTTSANAAARNAATNAGNAAFNRNAGAVGSPAWSRVQSAAGRAWSSNPSAVGSPAWERVHRASGGRGAGGGGVKPVTTLENNTWFGKLGTVEQLIRQAERAGHSESQIRQALQTGRLQKNVGPQSPTMVQAAYELLGWGALQPGTVQVLTRDMGLRIPRNVRVGHLPKTIGGLGKGALGGLKGLL